MGFVRRSLFSLKGETTLKSKPESILKRIQFREPNIHHNTIESTFHQTQELTRRRDAFKK